MPAGTPKRSASVSSPENFLTEGNGILRCYNMFPTQFRNIDEMTRYLPEVKKMGFNAVWINPIQYSGEVDNLFKRDKTSGVRAGNQVTQSLYAMTDSEIISPHFSVAPPETPIEEAAAMDQQALKNYTDTARSNGLVPMFDLVLNHVASDSRHKMDHPEWFHEQPHADFKDAIAFDYSKPTIREEIIEKFWRPYISKYMLDYGFDGVRVDAVGYLHPELRRRIYEIIYEIAEANHKPKPVILDEALFSDKSVDEAVEALLLPGIGPTHITGSTYYAGRDSYGVLPDWFKHEEGLKAQVVFLDKGKQLREEAKGGCIGFSGNHDHNSLGMTIINEMAHRRLEEHGALRDMYHRSMHECESAYDEAISSVFLYSFIKDIENEIIMGNDAVITEVETKMRDKIAISALTTSGGWYALSGDESGDLLAKPVFRRAHALEQPYYAQQTHKIFDRHHESHGAAMSALTAMAIENIMTEKVATAYQELAGNIEAQKRLLYPYIENIQNQINAGDTIVCACFQKKLKVERIDIQFSADDYIALPRTATNGWSGRHDMRSFMAGINEILNDLPASKFGFWSELIKLPSNPDLAIVVRKNGSGLDAETDIVIANLTPEKPILLTEKDIHDIACNFQLRVIPEGARNTGNPNYNLAYHCIMSCIGSGRIHLDPTIRASFPLREMGHPISSTPMTERSSNVATFVQIKQRLHSEVIGDTPGLEEAEDRIKPI